MATPYAELPEQEKQSDRDQRAVQRVVEGETMITIYLSIDGKALAEVLMQSLSADDWIERQRKQREAEERTTLMRKIAYDRILHGETDELEQEGGLNDE